MPSSEKTSQKKSVSSPETQKAILKANAKPIPLTKDLKIFKKFIASINRNGGTAHQCLENIAVHSIENKKMNFVCVGEFTLLQVRKLNKDPVLYKALSEFYNCSSFLVRLRRENEHLETTKEKRLRLQKEKKHRLYQLLIQEPNFRKIKEQFGLKNVRIRLDEE